MTFADLPAPKRPLTLTIFGILLGVFVVVNLGNALHKGGDFEVSLEAGKRFLAATPLYEDSTPGAGVTGPPFQSVWFAPFAALSGIHLGLSRILWYIVNVACLIGGIWCWTHAILPGRFSTSRHLWSSSEVLLPLLAIALPAQTNFEHQNMNALLLFLAGAGAMAIVRRSDIAAGGLLGTAVALKAFPLLLLCTLLIRRSWRVAVAGGAFAMGLTTLIVLRYGPAGGLRTFQDWIAISLNGGWPTRAQNQSLFAALTRLWPAEASVGHTVATAVFAGLVVWVSWKRRSLPVASAGAEIAYGLAIAVILSPIAWEHYWVLMFPILQATYAGDSKPGGIRRVAFWLAAVLITGPSPLFVGEKGYDLARAWSSSTIAAILLIGALTPTLLQKTSGRYAREPIT